MRLCDYHCIPCCDFCIYADHELFNALNKDGEMVQVIGGPIKCNKHKDTEHQMTAIMCGSCEDFHCFNIKDA